MPLPEGPVTAVVVLSGKAKMSIAAGKFFLLEIESDRPFGQKRAAARDSFTGNSLSSVSEFLHRPALPPTLHYLDGVYIGVCEEKSVNVDLL